MRLISFKGSPKQRSSPVPRSSGCASCKRRKVRCDESRPACQRCSKARLDCPGYLSPGSPPKRVSFPFKDQTQLTIAKAEGSWTSSRRTNYSQAPQGEGNCAAAEPVALNLNATSTQLYESFLDNFLPQDRDAQQAGYSYLVGLPSTTASHHALRSATQALSFVRLSTKSHDHNLLQHSRVAYGTSLTQLRLALSDTETANQDETLATILMLGLYELHKSVQEPTVGSANHYFGASRYIQLRGPESFRTDQSKILLNGHRNAMLVTGLQLHKRILYDRPEWLRVTRSFAQHDDWSALLDIGVHLPGILEATDGLVSNASPASMSSLAQSTVARLSEVRSRLTEWQQRFSERDGECWLVPLAEVPGMSAGLTEAAPFATAYTGRSYNHVHNTLLSTLYMCQVLRAALQVQHYQMIAMSDDGEEAAAEDVRTALEDEYRAHLSRLVQCFPFMQRPESSVTGWMVLAMAIWFARHASREVGLEEVASWCDGISEETQRQNMVSILDSSFESFPPLRPKLD